MEVMACGRALVSTAPVHAQELPADVAMLHARADARGLADALLCLRNQPDCRHNLEVRARDFVTKHHNLDDIVEQYVDVINRLLKPSVANA
jgi:hypothetical protein